MRFRAWRLLAPTLAGIVLISPCKAEVILEDDFLGSSINPAIWTVSEPGALYTLGGMLQVTDVSEDAPGPSGWHEGFVMADLPIGTDDFDFEIVFDFQSSTYQWLRVELLQADDSPAAVIARISDPSQYVLSQSGPAEVLNNPTTASGPYSFRISRLTNQMEFYWDDNLQGGATNGASISKLRLSFGRSDIYRVWDRIHRSHLMPHRPTLL